MSINTLAEIGLKAIEYLQLTSARKAAKHALSDGYLAFKDGRGIQRIEPGTDEWAAMMVATAPQHQAFTEAKAAERNARSRLERACRAATQTTGEKAPQPIAWFLSGPGISETVYQREHIEPAIAAMMQKTGHVSDDFTATALYPEPVTEAQKEIKQ